MPQLMTAIQRHRQHVLRRAALWVSLAYLIALTLIAFWPTPVDRDAHGSISSVVVWLHAHGVPTWLNYAVIEFSANIALFVPVGLLVVMLVGAHRWWLGPLIGAVVSSAIELGQLVFLPERFATVNDVVANTLGAVLGTVLTVGLLRLILGRHPSPPMS
jgi:glycopeptide antibiotics resistance protein